MQIVLAVESYSWLGRGVRLARGKPSSRACVARSAVCDRALALRVLGHRASLEWNQDRRWLTGSPDGADGAVVAILVRMKW